MSIVHQHVSMDLEKEDFLFSSLCLSGGVLIRVVLRHTHLIFKDPASRQILLALWYIKTNLCNCVVAVCQKIPNKTTLANSFSPLRLGFQLPFYLASLINQPC